MVSYRARKLFIINSFVNSNTDREYPRIVGRRRLYPENKLKAKRNLTKQRLWLDRLRYDMPTTVERNSKTIKLLVSTLGSVLLSAAAFNAWHTRKKRTRLVRWTNRCPLHTFPELKDCFLCRNICLKSIDRNWISEGRIFCGFVMPY